MIVTFPYVVVLRDSLPSVWRVVCQSFKAEYIFPREHSNVGGSPDSHVLELLVTFLTFLNPRPFRPHHLLRRRRRLHRLHRWRHY